MAPRFGMATYCREPLGPQLEDARSLGFDYVELDLTGPPALDAAVLRALEGSAAPPPASAHLAEVARREDLERAKALVGLLAPWRLSLINLHLPGQVGLGPTARQLELLAELVAHALSQGVTVTAENTWEGPVAMEAFLDQVEGLEFCLDLGHANLLTAEYQGGHFLQRLRRHLRLVHVSDNKGGKLDLHIPVGRGTVPFPYVLRRLASVGYDGPYTLEIFRARSEERAESLGRVRELLDAPFLGPTGTRE